MPKASKEKPAADKAEKAEKAAAAKASGSEKANDDGPQVEPLTAEGENENEKEKVAVIKANTVFKPMPAKRDLQGNELPVTGKRSRLQPAGYQWPQCPEPESSEDTDTRGDKQHRVDGPGFVPSFCMSTTGAITGMPFYNGKAKPVPCQTPTPFVQPMWPDPEMLHKLHEGGSIANPKAHPTVEEYATLQKLVSQLVAKVDTLQKTVDGLQESGKRGTRRS